MSKNNSTTKNEAQDSAVVRFEKVSDNVGRVITIRNGETYSIELFSLTEENISEIKKIRSEITKERLLAAV